jgi:hypothetical protein
MVRNPTRLRYCDGPRMCGSYVFILLPYITKSAFYSTEWCRSELACYGHCSTRKGWSWLDTASTVHGCYELHRRGIDRDILSVDLRCLQDLDQTDCNIIRTREDFALRYCAIRGGIGRVRGFLFFVMSTLALIRTSLIRALDSAAS